MGLNNFITSSDYGTLKNDTQTNTISATIADNFTWDPTTTTTLASATLVIGTVNAGIRARGVSDKFSSRIIVGTTLYSTLAYEIPSLPLTGQSTTLYCNLERISATTVKLSLNVEASPGAPNFKTEEAQTVTFVFSTFLSPFD